MGLSAKLVRSQLNFFKPFVASCSLEVTRKGQDKLGELMEVIHRHNVIVKDGIQCTCGRKGCWERYASASALTRETKVAMQAHKETIMWKMTPDIDHVNAKLSFDAAAKGDAVAKSVVDSWIEYVGVGIANVINTFEPEIICIGGGVSNQGETLLAPVRAYAENETKNITTGRFPKIVACTLHNDAGVIGAAALENSI